MRTDAIMVSLVGTGSGPHTWQQKKDLSTLDQTPKKIATTQTYKPQQMQDSISLQAKATIQNETATDSIPQGNGGEVGSRAGMLTPNQWQLIQSALERAKNYPRMARERGIEGVVHIRFRILPSGDVECVEILKSSGHAILDSASVETVYQSRPLPYVTGWVEVPIAYEIK
jgi:protein TonB